MGSENYSSKLKKLQFQQRYEHKAKKLDRRAMALRLQDVFEMIEKEPENNKHFRALVEQQAFQKISDLGFSNTSSPTREELPSS